MKTKPRNNSSPKYLLNLFASFKTTFKFETYLDFLTDFNVRSSFSKFRLSLHNLQIEAGRFHKNKTPRDERFCLYCKTANVFEVGDGIHFVPKYLLNYAFPIE